MKNTTARLADFPLPSLRVGATRIGPGKVYDGLGKRPATLITALACLLTWNQPSFGVPPGCKPPELVISAEHPLVILYGPGSGALTVKCWQHLPADIRPYCAITM